MPEFPRTVLDTLRQPMESGEVMVARASAHVRYPCRFLLVAAANPCRCGHMGDAEKACSKAPVCGQDYMGRISGPLMDRFDLRVDVPPVSWQDLDLPADGERSATVAARVQAAREIQSLRYEGLDVRVNSEAEGELLDEVARPDAESRVLLQRVAERFGLTARGYHRVLRVVRTIADLEEAPDITRSHIAEAVSYRTVLSAK